MKHDVEQQVPQGVVVFHHAAAELDDRDLVAELANPAQGFDQHVGLLDGALLANFGQGSELPQIPVAPLEPIREPPAERGKVPFCFADYAKGDSPRRFSDRLLVHNCLTRSQRRRWTAIPQSPLAPGQTTAAWGKHVILCGPRGVSTSRQRAEDRSTSRFSAPWAPPRPRFGPPGRWLDFEWRAASGRSSRCDW